jgi:ABC-type antimicrobial peptide transport system permease subunit
MRWILTIMAIVFAVVAVGAALFGLAMTLHEVVTRQKREFVVRLALGARAVDIHRLVVGRGLRMVAIGFALGLAGLLAARPAIDAQLFGVTTLDGVILPVAALSLGAAATIAALLPASRAARLDPIETLRHDGG